MVIFRKKAVFLGVFIVIAGIVSAQTIFDYFPASIGNMWTYSNSKGTTVEIRTLKNSVPDPSVNDGSQIYLLETQFPGIGSTSTVYGIRENKIIILIVKNILGQSMEYQKPYPVELAPAGQEWRYNDRGDDLRLKTSRTSCRVDDRAYIDCILVEERVVDGSKTIRTQKSYYAKGIGLVLVTLQEPGRDELVHLKLTSCNFTDIEKTIDDEYSRLQNDMAATEEFFFTKLAQVGIENIDKQIDGLSNDTQQKMFILLLDVVRNNLITLMTMISSGNVNISEYLNAPIPDYLVTIHFDNKPLAAAFDKAVKIIVLSNVLHGSRDSFKNAIPDQRYLEGTKSAEPLLSPLYKYDKFISSDEYNTIMEPFYKTLMEVYLENGGK